MSNGRMTFAVKNVFKLLFKIVNIVLTIRIGKFRMFRNLCFKPPSFYVSP